MAKIPVTELLSPAPINFHSLKIYKPTLKEISEIGFDLFERGTKLLCLSDIEIADFHKSENQENGEIEPFLFLLGCMSDKRLSLEIQIAFFTYLKKPVLVTKSGFFFDNDKGEKICITRERFTEFQNIIRQINMRYDADDEREIITDNLKMKQKFMEKRRLLKQAKIKQAQKEAESGESMTMGQIISCLCTYGTGYTMLNVWDLTIYQLYDQFYRCQKRESYESGMAALRAGADSKKVKVIYWMKD